MCYTCLCSAAFRAGLGKCAPCTGKKKCIHTAVVISCRLVKDCKVTRRILPSWRLRVAQDKLVLQPPRKAIPPWMELLHKQNAGRAGFQICCLYSFVALLTFHNSLMVAFHSIIPVKRLSITLEINQVSRVSPFSYCN